MHTHSRSTLTTFVLGFCSFTSNYQSTLMKTYRMSHFQIMFGVNFFSCTFTLWSLLLVSAATLRDRCFESNWVGTTFTANPVAFYIQRAEQRVCVLALTRTL